MLLEQLKRVELFNGRAAMLGIAIGIITEGLTGSGIAHQIGLGALIDGYAACRLQESRKRSGQNRVIWAPTRPADAASCATSSS